MSKAIRLAVTMGDPGGIGPEIIAKSADRLRGEISAGRLELIVLGSANGDKVSLIAGVTADLTGKVKAGELVNFVAQQVGGKGGGRPDMAQAGGTQPENLPAALQGVNAWVEAKL